MVSSAAAEVAGDPAGSPPGAAVWAPLLRWSRAEPALAGATSWSSLGQSPSAAVPARHSPRKMVTSGTAPRARMLPGKAPKVDRDRTVTVWDGPQQAHNT